MSDCEFNGHIYASARHAAAARREQSANAERLAELRDKRIQAHEAALKRAYLSVAGADEAGWEREKASILAEACRLATLARKDEARKASATLYRNF